MLSKKRRYLQVALNSSPGEGEAIISTLPSSDRILIEAGTPLIKAYGVEGIRRLKNAWQAKRAGYSSSSSGENVELSLIGLISSMSKQNSRQAAELASDAFDVYVVADTK